MPRRPSLLLAIIALGFSCSLAACRQEAPPVLDSQTLLERQDWWDNRDWLWYEENIPFLETPDPELDATYYYRWEVLTKHLVYGSKETGYTFTEFIDRPFWSGTYGAISCPLGHQAYEIRWLKNPRVIEDFARYWFETPGAEPRSYSNWYGDAMWAAYQVSADTAFLATVLPHMEAQVAGWTEERWDPEHRMYRWVGAWDGMETNINSRLTEDEFGGGEGYRPTLNSYLFADMMAISRAAALFGQPEKATAYRNRALALKARLQEELWDPDREFFFHQFAFDEQGGIEAKSLTYQTGPYAGDPHGRELLGYVPWQFNLPDSGYESAWGFLMDPEYFWAPYGPTGVEQGDPQFFVSPRCCVWSGNAWPYATSQTLTALANLLNNYDQDVVDRTDYWQLLRTYALSHRRNGRPYIAEAADPFSGSWDGHNTFYHSEHYLHSGFLDQIVTGLVGLRPRADDVLRVNPLAPRDWDFFALEGVAYHGHDLSIIWDREGTRYGIGAGLAVILDGEEIGRRSDMGEIQVAIPPPVLTDLGPRLRNYAIHNDGGAYPRIRASSSHPLFPAFYAVDGNRWYHPSPPNRWVAGTGSAAAEGDSQGGMEGGDGSGAPAPSSGAPAGSEWLQVEFGGVRPLSSVQLYFLDDEDGPTREATGEEEASGFPFDRAEGGVPVRPPSSVHLESWGNSGWVVVQDQERIPEHPAGRRANTIRFPEIRTAGIRVVMTPMPGTTVGLTEIEAWGREAEEDRSGEPAAPRGIEPGESPAGGEDLSISPNGINLALNPSGEGFPRVSASHTYPSDSPWQAVDGRITFTRYSRNRWTAFGSPNPSDWLEVDFEGEHEVRRVELFLYGDGGGVAAPESYRIEVWRDGRWTVAEEEGRMPLLPTAWARNVVELKPLTTDRVRVVFRHALPAASGVAELEVFGG